MAIKNGPYRIVSEADMYFAAITFTGYKGGIVSLTSGSTPSGAAWDSNESQVAYHTGFSGVIPVGLLLNDVIGTDPTRHELNRYRDEVSPGSKVTVVTKGEFVTNFIDGTPTNGAAAFLAGTGTFSPTSGTGAAQVGKFITIKDADGYATVQVDL